MYILEINGKLPLYLLLILTVLPVSALGDNHKVSIIESAANESLLFRPIFLKAKVGDSVKFDSELPGHLTQSVFVPDGANTWRGTPEKTASVILNKEGIYIYECRFHGNLGMAGIIQAGKPSNLNKAKDFYYKYKQKFIINKDRLDNIIDTIQ